MLALPNQNLPTLMKFIKSLFASSDDLKLNSASTKSFTESWPQIKIFYEVLLNTNDKEGKINLNLLKSNSKILVLKAEELSIEEMPADYRKPKTIETLLSLKKQTILVDDLVKNNAPDSELKVALTKLYNAFFIIVELCTSEK